MTSTVIYNGDLRTTCTHLRSGSDFETDAPVDNNGKGRKIFTYRPYGHIPCYMYGDCYGHKGKNNGLRS